MDAIDPRLVEIRDCLYRVAVKAFILRERKVLLVRDKGDKYWSFPGGGIDYGESTIQALERELYEEVKLKDSDIAIHFPIVGITCGHQKDGIPRVNIFFSVTVKSESKISTTTEIEEFMWVSLSELQATKFEESTGDLTDILPALQQLLS